MSQLLDIVKNKLLVETFYVPSLKTEIKGKTLTINQYNKILELSMLEPVDRMSNYMLLTDEIIQENIESTDNLSYFDKVFLLLQMKIAQSNEYYGVNSEIYKETLRSRCEDLDITQFDKEYNHNGIKILLGISSFNQGVELNNTVYNKSDSFDVKSILICEILRSIKKIEFEDTDLDTKELKPIDLINSIPASLIEFNKGYQHEINLFITNANKFVYNEQEFSLYPSIDVMLL